MAYNFTIRYKATAQHGNADGLSRLPAGPDLEFDNKVDNCKRITEDANDGFPMQATQLAKATTKDVELSRVWRYIQGGPCWGKSWLVCVDAFSKYPYVVEMKGTSTAATISALDAIFTIEGFPETIEVWHSYYISALSSSVKWVSEALCAYFKTAVQKGLNDGFRLSDAIKTMLFSFRTAPSSNDNKSPAELLHGRQPRLVLDLLRPSMIDLRDKDEQGKGPEEREARGARRWHSGDEVFVRNFHEGPKWLPGVITATLGTVNYRVETERGTWMRHHNQLRSRSSNKESFTEDRER
ncbi:hypothetical protein D918_08391 [Trichuris suis]|nr:hypothetical protein D918_08391 [Trichuris suis]